MIDENLRARFILKFDEGDEENCWNWKASTAGMGYGQIKLTGQRRQVYAHRVAYMIANGDIPEGMEVCHKCDNPKCVNPKHLFLGTRKDNAEDMANKFRSTFGENGATAKLTEKDVGEIRKLLKSEIPQTKIASLYGVSQIQISRINTGKQWQKVK